MKDGQIYDANAPMLVSRTSALSCSSKFYGKVDDNEKEIRDILSKALQENDIILISGGVSMGILIMYIRSLLISKLIRYFME
ncbi:molybdopterin-binding protein [Brachyspira hyodysenteriae]|nr:molybdopterin-binding protein [Brachyspira hyodysenteriae]MDA1468599.1 molybdopterin-binding protein [Brachyspira hyodysenteriae]